MFASIAGFVAARSTSIVGALGEGTVKGSLILAAGLGLVWLMRGQSAARRHLVLGLALLAAAAMPLVTRVVPSWNVALPAAVASAVASAIPSASVDAVAFAAVSEPTQAPNAERASTSDAGASTSVSTASVDHAADRASPATILTIAWLVVAVMLLARVLASVVTVARLTRRADPVSGNAWQGLLTHTAQSFGVHRPVRLLASDDTEVPMTWGIVRPVVLLTADYAEWSAERRSSVLRHELAHVARRDAVTELAAQICCAVYWFNPLVWVTVRALRRERERTCDDRVLAAGSKASAYAGELLDIARSALGTERHGVALAMARRSQIEGRLLAILDPRLRREVPGRTAGVVLGAVALALTIPLAAFRAAPAASMEPMSHVVQVPPRTDSVPLSRGAELPRARKETAKPAPQVEHPRQSAPVPTQAAQTAQIAQHVPQCGGASQSTSHTSHTGDDGSNSWNASWSGNNCSVDIRAQDIKITVGATPGSVSVSALRSGAYMEINEREGSTTHRIELRVSGPGATAYTYSVNGQIVFTGAAFPAGSAGGDLLLATFVELERHTGLAFSPRVRALLSAGGVTAVLDEIPQLFTDYVRGLYFTQLLASASLTDDEVIRVANTAAATLTADYELDHALMAIADRYTLKSGELRAVFLGAAAKLSSDHTRGRMLSRIADFGPLPRESLVRMLGLTAQMSSGWEIVDVLERVASHNQIDGNVRDAYMAATAHLQADYENRRAMDALRRGQK